MQYGKWRHNDMTLPLRYDVVSDKNNRPNDVYIFLNAFHSSLRLSSNTEKDWRRYWHFIYASLPLSVYYFNHSPQHRVQRPSLWEHNECVISCAVVQYKLYSAFTQTLSLNKEMNMKIATYVLCYSGFIRRECLCDVYIVQPSPRRSARRSAQWSTEMFTRQDRCLNRLCPTRSDRRSGESNMFHFWRVGPTIVPCKRTSDRWTNCRAVNANYSQSQQASLSIILVLNCCIIM